MIVSSELFKVSIPTEHLEEYIKEKGINDGVIELFQEVQIIDLDLDLKNGYLNIEANLLRREDS